MNNYDPVARYYDFLTQLVFGKTEINAQVEMLDRVRPGDKLLIVGGGTGWILEKLAGMGFDGLRIVYVESSQVMMAMAQKRDIGTLDVSFVQLPVEQFFTDDRFDCILTGFLFDNFSQELAERVVRNLDLLLVDGGYWLFAELHYPQKGGKRWHGLLLRSMYWAARWICRVEADRLPDVEGVFAGLGYEVIQRRFYYQGFIQGVVYRKG